MSSIRLYSTRKSKSLRKKNFEKTTYSKDGPSGAPGSSAEGGHFLNCQHFCHSWRCFVAKHPKIEAGKTFIFGKKSHSAEKKLKGGTLWHFPTSILSQISKKNEGGTLWGENLSGKKSCSAEKNWKGGPFGLAVYGLLRGKTGNTFLVQFARPHSAIWCSNNL